MYVTLNKISWHIKFLLLFKKSNLSVDRAVLGPDYFVVWKKLFGVTYIIDAYFKNRDNTLTSEKLSIQTQTSRKHNLRE